VSVVQIRQTRRCPNKLSINHSFNQPIYLYDSWIRYWTMYAFL